jgi:predicted nuclease of restriction endonuclease-like (RecB) superfamily
VIISRCQSLEEAEYYVQNTITHGWSRSVLTHQIESGLWQREGKAQTNFIKVLPSPQSDLATQTLRDPYTLREGNERGTFRLRHSVKVNLTLQLHTKSILMH